MPTEPPDLEPPSHDLPSIELPVSTTTTATTNRAFLRQKSLVRAATMISRFETKKMEQPLMLLWVPGGFCLGIIFTYLSFGVIPLEDPTIPENSWWQCMFTCATMWYGLYSALTVYVFHTNVIRRHELAILGLKWRFLSAYLVGSVLLAAVWSLMAEPWKTDRVHFPFIGVIGAICGVLLGNVAISLVVPLRLHYKELRKGIIWTSIFNALGMVGSIAIYWGVLETIISVKNAVPDTLWWLPAASAGPLYYVAKVLSKATLRRMLYESHNRDYDSTYAPVLSWWMAVLHSSFMCVTVGLSAWLAAIVIIAIDVVLLLRSMRVLSKRKQGAAVLPIAGVVPVAQAQASSVEEAEKNRRLLIKHMTYLVFTKTAELAVPIMYAVIAALLRQSVNSRFIGGVGATFWHFDEDLSKDESFNIFIEKLMALVAVDVCSLAVIFLWANRQGLSLLRVYYAVCVEFGPYLCLVLAFLVDHQFCILVYHCGMDFTGAFKFYGKPNDGQLV